MHKKHKICNKTTQRKQKKHTHIQYCLDSYGNQHVSSLAESSNVTGEFRCSSSG